MAQAASKPGALGPSVVLGFLFMGFREHRSTTTVWCILKMKNDKSEPSPEEGSWRESLDSCEDAKKTKTRGWEELTSEACSFICYNWAVSLLTFSCNIWNNCTVGGNG